MKLSKVLREMGVLAIFCDLDDTLIPTHGLFGVQIALFLEAVVRDIQDIQYRDIESRLKASNDELFLASGPQRNNWRITVQRLILHYGPEFSHIFWGHYHYLDEIYQKSPSWKEGALEFLSQIAEENIPLVIVTHANKKWTLLKMERLELWKYVAHVYIVPEAGHKTAREWASACSLMKLSTSEVIAIGDSTISDMRPSCEAGISKRIWVNNAVGWDLYKAKGVPAGTLEVTSVSEIVPLLLTKPW